MKSNLKSSNSRADTLAAGLFEIQGNQLQAMYSPGIYEIMCTVTGKSYFGESNSLLERLGRHYRHLNEGKRILDAPEFQKDWNQYGPEAFIFRILLFGIEWRSKTARRQQELHYITTNSTRVYNKYPATPSTYRLQCCIEGISYTSIAEAARAQSLSASEIRRRLENPTSTTYILEKKVSNGKPCMVDGVWYPTRQEAAKRLKCSRTTILRRIKKADTNTSKGASNDYPEWE